MADTAITRTDDDALAARASAVKLQYWQDDFIKYFVKSVERKAPVINRGTHVRTYAIDEIVRHFLASAGPPGSTKQIISLGAGSDTRFFSLAASAISRNGSIPFRYHEIDFPDVCRRKCLTMTTRKGLKDILYSQASTPVIDGRAGSIHSDAYCLHPLDLSRIADLQEELPLVDPCLETLVISEVCLIYLDVEAADRVLSWTTRFTKAAVIIYEPIRDSDAFGMMMIRNLAARGLVLKTLEKYATLESQRQRLREAGFTTVHACTMNDVYDNWMSSTERERISKLEMFDEIEEWIMLAEHYCVAVGWRHLDTMSSLVRYLN